MSDTIGYRLIGSGTMGSEHLLDLNHIEWPKWWRRSPIQGMGAVAMGSAAHRLIDERCPVELSEYGLG